MKHMQFYVNGNTAACMYGGTNWPEMKMIKMCVHVTKFKLSYLRDHYKIPVMQNQNKTKYNVS